MKIGRLQTAGVTQRLLLMLQEPQALNQTSQSAVINIVPDMERPDSTSGTSAVPTVTVMPRTPVRVPCGVRPMTVTPPVHTPPGALAPLIPGINAPRRRRCGGEDRAFACPVADCLKPYYSMGAVKLHIKTKHKSIKAEEFKKLTAEDFKRKLIFSQPSEKPETTQKSQTPEAVDFDADFQVLPTDSEADESIDVEVEDEEMPELAQETPANGSVTQTSDDSKEGSSNDDIEPQDLKHDLSILSTESKAFEVDETSSEVSSFKAETPSKHEKEEITVDDSIKLEVALDAAVERVSPTFSDATAPSRRSSRRCAAGASDFTAYFDEDSE